MEFTGCLTKIRWNCLLKGSKSVAQMKIYVRDKNSVSYDNDNKGPSYAQGLIQLMSKAGGAIDEQNSWCTYDTFEGRSTQSDWDAYEFQFN